MEVWPSKFHATDSDFFKKIILLGKAIQRCVVATIWPSTLACKYILKIMKTQIQTKTCT